MFVVEQMYDRKYIFGNYNIYLIYSDPNGISLYFLISYVTAICIRSLFWWGWWQHFKLKIPAQWDSFNTSFLEWYFGKLPCSPPKQVGLGKDVSVNRALLLLQFLSSSPLVHLLSLLSYSISKHPAVGWWTARFQCKQQSSQNTHVSAAYTVEKHTATILCKRNN